MPRGGSRPGERRGGRKKGSKNNRIKEREAAIAASGLTPLDYLLSVLRDEGAPAPLRLDAAKSAAPFVHPRLAAVTVQGDLGVTHAAAEDDRAWIARQIARRADSRAAASDPGADEPGARRPDTSGLASLGPT